MALIIIGIIVLIIAIVLRKQEREEIQKLAIGVRILAFLLIIIGFLTSCIKQIDAGQIGVKSLFGKVSDETTLILACHFCNSGLNMVNPLIDVKTVDIKTQNYT